MSADFSTRPRAETSPRLARWGAALGAVLLAASTAHAVRAVSLRDAARADIARREAEVLDLRRRLERLERPSGPEATLRRQVDLTARAAPSRVLADLAPLLPPGVQVERLLLDYGDELELELRVEARSPAEYDRLLEALGSSDRLSGVLPGPESREGGLATSVRAVYRPRGTP